MRRHVSYIHLSLKTLTLPQKQFDVRRVTYSTIRNQGGGLTRSLPLIAANRPLTLRNQKINLTVQLSGSGNSSCYSLLSRLREHFLLSICTWRSWWETLSIILSLLNFCWPWETDSVPKRQMARRHAHVVWRHDAWFYFYVESWFLVVVRRKVPKLTSTLLSK